MMQSGTMPHTHAHSHTLRAVAGHYVMELLLLKVCVDHVARSEAATLRHALTPSLSFADLKTLYSARAS